MKQLSNSTLHALDAVGVERSAPGEPRAVTVLQIGEGNFMRGFFDWMIQQCHTQGLYDGGIAVIQPRPSGKPKIDKLADQDGLYTLVIRGLEDGERIERKEIISAVANAFDPYSAWDTFLSFAASSELQIVVSNTTEAGLVYRPEPLVEGAPIESFPGKMALLLYKRYLAFEGSPERGLLFLPCELLERNGDTLKECVLRYAEDWGFSAEFHAWVRDHNRFLNSLVDRIVTGHPGEEQAEAWFAEWGYRDELVCMAEPYHLWAIEAEPELERILPLRQAGLNVHWVEDLKPYQQRKVRILNGAHTLMTPLGLLHGIEQVRELMEHPELGTFVREAVRQEIIPTLPYPAEELAAYADTVFERYLNPFIRHRLADIAMNSISKFKVRLLPSLAAYAERGAAPPDRLARGFAGLLRYYRVKREGRDGNYRGTALNGTTYTVRDDASALDVFADSWAVAESRRLPPIETAKLLLAQPTLWGRDLSAWNGLAEAVGLYLAEFERSGL
jgi:tagaturonate reductase